MKIVLVLLTAAAMCLPAAAQTQVADLTNQIASDSTTSASDPQTLPPPGPGKPAEVEPAKPAPSGGPLQIKIGDVAIKFGLLLQPQGDFSQDTTGHTAQNLLLRRTRFIVGGQFSKQAFFFFQTENSRLGNATTTKTIASGFQTIDAVGEYRFSKPLNIWIGLIYLPTSREALKSSASEFMIDVNSYAYTATTALQGTGGRDTGAMLRGYFLGDRLEYRAGAFAGVRSSNGARNPFRTIGRVQYDFFDTEVYNLPSYAGANFGTKKIVALGAAYDKQGSYTGPTADLFWDVPTGFGSALGTATVMRLDGGTIAPSLSGRSKIFVLDGGVFMKGSKLGPWARYERRDFSHPNSSKDEKRWLVGVNWYPYLNNFNIKAAVGELRPAVGRNQRQATVQMQIFYF